MSSATGTRRNTDSNLRHERVSHMASAAGATAPPARTGSVDAGLCEIGCELKDLSNVVDGLRAALEPVMVHVPAGEGKDDCAPNPGECDDACRAYTMANSLALIRKRLLDIENRLRVR